MVYVTTKLYDAVEELLTATGETVFVLHYGHAAIYRSIGIVGFSIKKARELCSKIEKAKKLYDKELQKTVECQYDIETDELRVDIEANNEQDWYRCKELLEML